MGDVAKSVPKFQNSCYSIKVMKIDGPKSSSDVQRKKDVKKSSSSDGTFGALLSGAESPQQSAGAGLSQGIAGVDALLMAQAAEDPTERAARNRMKHRAGEILDKLQDLKISLVTGNVTVGHMVSIADVVASHRETITDPNLTEILDEIDLRANVELAKLKIAKSKLS